MILDELNRITESSYPVSLRVCEASVAPFKRLGY